MKDIDDLVDDERHRKIMIALRRRLVSDEEYELFKAIEKANEQSEQA